MSLRPFDAGPGQRPVTLAQGRPERGVAESRDDGTWMSRYAALADQMYAIRRQYPELEQLGLSVLSPRHAPPPDHVRLVEALNRNGQAAQLRAPSPAAIALRWLRCLVYAVSETVRVIGLQWRFGRALMAQPADMIIRSWCFGPGGIPETGDFYFGTLSQQLEARGLRCILLCGDTRERNDAAFAEGLLRSPGVRAMPDLLLLPWQAPLQIAMRQLRTALRLRRVAAQAESSGARAIAATACRNSVEPITLRNTLQFDIAKSAVSRWQARVFITLYEGQPWEQQAWRGAKAGHPDCITVGYQHTVVMPHSLGVLQPPRINGHPAGPDLVLCLGEITREMMAKGHEEPQRRLMTFGTFRRSGPALQAAPQPERRTVLVVPETGVLREAKTVFNFALRAAEALPEYRFLFRCHPAMPFERLRAQLDRGPEGLPNVEISVRPTIAEDFERASALLYRGSSTVLYAVLHGLKPIYLEDPAFPDVDPLFAVTGWRERIDSVDGLRRALEQPANDAAWRAAVSYVDAYTVPVTAESIDRFIQAAGLAQPEVAACR